jgi:hypothetical protein
VRARKGVRPADRVNDQQDRHDKAFGKKRSRSSLTPPGTRIFAVTDGRRAVGIITVIADSLIATDVSGEIIGTFPTLRDATRALPGRAR